MSSIDDLEIVVPFTTPELTRAALHKSAQWARGLRVRIRVVWVQIVPYPLSIGSPPVRRAFFESAMAGAASRYGAMMEHYLTRDAEALWRAVIPPDALVAIGTRRHFWQTREERLAQRLRRNGNEVVCHAIESEDIEDWSTPVHDTLEECIGTPLR